jgi:hypothetical protein
MPGYSNEHGEWVPGTDANYPVWAAALDLSFSDQIAATGNRLGADRVWRVRWFAELATALATTATVTDADGTTFSVTKIIEITGPDGRTRRRWLDIEAAAEVPA